MSILYTLESYEGVTAVTPFLDGAPLDECFVFNEDDTETMQDFMAYYSKNPVSAMFAYEKYDELQCAV